MICRVEADTEEFYKLADALDAEQDNWVECESCHEATDPDTSLQLPIVGIICRSCVNDWLVKQQPQDWRKVGAQIGEEMSNYAANLAFWKPSSAIVRDVLL
jgi:hypothetical protein